MKRFPILIATGLITLGSTTAFSQSRDVGARSIILDDGVAGKLTIQYAGPGSGTLTLPNGGGSMPAAGTTADGTLRWGGTSWVQNTNLLAGPNGIITSRTTTGNAGPYFGIDGTINDNNGGTISNTAVIGIRMTATESAGGDDEAIGGWFRGVGSALSPAYGGRFSATGGSTNIGVEVTAGGISNTGGLDNNSGGITEAGAISGATTITASGAITGLSATLNTKNTATGTLRLTPTFMALTDYTNIVFADGDAGTGPMELRYTDDTSPSIHVLGGALTLGSLRVASGSDKYAGSVSTDDASGDAIELISNTSISASSIVVVTLNSALGATHVVNAVPGAGMLTVTFSANVPDGSKLSYVIINP